MKDKQTLLNIARKDEERLAEFKVDTRVVAIEHQSKQIAFNKDEILANYGDILENEDRINSNTASINKNSADIADLRKDFEAMAKDYNKFKERTNGAIAGVAAMGQLAQPYGVGNVNVGVAIGHYDSEQAISVGMGYRATESVTIRAAVAANSGNDMEPIIAGSLNYEF